MIVKTGYIRTSYKDKVFRYNSLFLQKNTMSEISNIATTLGAYLTRPQLYPELGRKIYKNIFDRQSAFKGKNNAEIWCREHAVSQSAAIEQLGYKDYKSLKLLHPDEINFAEAKEQLCPVTMGGAGALDLIYYLAEYTNAKNILETGVAYGWSSLAALLSLQSRNGALYSSDMPYLGKDNDKEVGCVVPEHLRKNWKLFRLADKESLPKIFKQNSIFDLIHYDSDKAYNGRRWAYTLLWKHLREGGVLMSDDISDNAAFMDFCLEHNFQPVIVEFDGKYAGFIKK